MPSYSFVQNVINYFELTENDLIKYQIGVSEEYTYKAKINEEIKGINVDSYKEINHLLKMIKYYQEVMQNHNRKG
nr:hypothetical protein [Piscibacillus salipiscarius]